MCIFVCNGSARMLSWRRSRRYCVYKKVTSKIMCQVCYNVLEYIIIQHNYLK